MISAPSVEKTAESFETLGKLVTLAELKEVVIVKKRKGSGTIDPLKKLLLDFGLYRRSFY